MQDELSIKRNKELGLVSRPNGINYNVTFAPVARLETNGMLVAFACFEDSKSIKWK